MAGEISRAYHDELRAEERQRVALRIANGTKASSPQIVSYRRQHPDYTGSGGDAVGSFNRPFFANKDESQKQLSGGVLRNFQYARSILGQRAKDDLARQAELQGVPGEVARAEGEPPILSERESRELELNQLLSALQDEIESGNVGGIAFTEVKQIPRLLISLIPGFSAQELARLRRFVGDMLADVVVEGTRAQDELPPPAAAAAAAALPPAGPLPGGRSAAAIAAAALAADAERRALVAAQDAAARARIPADNRNNIERLMFFLKNIFDYISIAEDDVGSDPQTRVARAKAVGKELFDPKKVFVKVGKATLRRPGEPPQFNVETVASVPGRRKAPGVPGAPPSTTREVGAKQRAVNIITRKIEAGENVGGLALNLKVDIGDMNRAQAREALVNKIKKTPVRRIREIFNIVE